MSRTRKLLLIVAGLFVLVIIALLLLPFLIDVNVYRGSIEAKAEEILGRDVTLGEMRLTFLPLGLRVDDIGIGSLPEEGEGDLLTAESLRIGARLGPLLAKRLEITSLVIKKPTMLLARDAGGNWNVQKLIATEATEAVPAESAEPAGGPGIGAVAVDKIRITGGRITLRDAAINPGTVFEASLEEIDLTISDLAIDRRVSIDLSAGLDALPGGSLEFEGKVGPLVPPEGESFRFDGELALDDIDPEALGRLLQKAGLLETVPSGFFAGRTVGLTSKLEVGFRTGETGSVLDLDKLDVDLDGTRLSLSGSVADEGELERLDLTLAPSEIRAEHIRSLLALVAEDAPVTFESGSPLEIEAKVTGLLGEGRLPDIEGRASLKGYTFYHPSLKTPMKEVGATVKIRNDGLEIDGLTAVVGSSDVTGDLTMTDFSSPRVTFDIRSKYADFFELFSFMEPPEETAETATAGTDTAAEDLMSSVVVEGQVAIERGSFQKLEFTNLQATMRWADGVLRMDPFRMKLYDGSFDGTLTYEPFADPPVYAVGGRAAGIELAPILADGLEVEGLIAGKFTGEVNAHGAGSDYESIVRGMKGGGSARIDDGFLGALDILGTLSNVSGIFGEQTLSSLSRQLATDGTEFDTASVDLVVDGGKLRLNNLAIRSPGLDLKGRGAVDMLSQGLAGDLQVVFSEEISNSMRAENSRAGKAFWNSRSNRVEFPFELSGTMVEPSVGIDWSTAARTVVEREAREEIEDLVSKKLGAKIGGGSAPADAQKNLAPEPAAESRTGPAGLEATITEVSWGGSFLAKDLRFKGKIRGERLDHATLVVTDAAGSVIKRVDDVNAVRAWLNGASDKSAMANIDWQNEVDGKKIVLASPPFTITLTVYNTDGESAEVKRTVNR